MRELAAYAHVRVPADAVTVRCTSAGLRISAGVTDTAPGETVYHYTVSSAERPLRAVSGARLATLLGRLRHPGRPWALVESGHGEYHVLFPSPRVSDPAGGQLSRW